MRTKNTKNDALVRKNVPLHADTEVNERAPGHRYRSAELPDANEGLPVKDLPSRAKQTDAEDETALDARYTRLGVTKEGYDPKPS